MARGWRKQTLATGKISHHGVNSRTFDEFCEEQRVRIALRDFHRQARGLHESFEDLESVQTERNDHFTRRRLMVDAEVEIRGHV